MKYLKYTASLFIGILFIFLLATARFGATQAHAQALPTQSTSSIQAQLNSIAQTIASMQARVNAYLQSIVTANGLSQRAQVSGTSLISGLSSSFTKGTFTAGSTFYTDRTYAITSVPSNLNGDLLIKTHNDDKLNTSSNYLSFTVNQASTVFVAFDTRITTHPSWLTAFTDTGTKVVTSDVPHELYSKTYVSGSTVTLGGNAASPSNANSNSSNYYVVVAQGSGTSSSAGTNAGSETSNTSTPTPTPTPTPTTSYPNGAPYPQSSVITGVTWNYGSKQQLAHGSDMWPITWGSDGNLYSIWGDGGGFSGSNSNGRVSTGIARISGTPPNLTTANINGGVNSLSTPTWACSSCAKSDAILSIGGTLYAWIGFQRGSPEIHKMMWSTDFGKTWHYSSWSIPMSSHPVVRYGSFLNFGKDYQGARDNYVYIYSSPPNNNTDLWLIRVPKDQLLTPSAYQVFTGTNTQGIPLWSTNTSAAKAIFTDPKGASWQQESYDPYLHRYLLATVHGGNTLSGGDFGYGDWGMFDAPNPWGPWTTVTYMTNWQNTYPKFSFKIPQKWMNPNGKNFTMVYSGTGPYDSWNTIDGTFTVNTSTSGTTPAPTLSISASPTSVTKGGSSTLTWSSTNATSCTASGAWSGGKSTSGSQTITNLQSSGTYKLTCTGAGGSTAHSVSISVTTPTSTQTTTSTPASTSSGSNSISSLQPGHWYKVPNSHLEDVSPTPFDSRVRNVINSWSGGTFDTKRDNFIIWGGGHGDYWGNEIYTFNVDTLKWKRVNNPYLPAKNFPWGTTATILPDGSPGSRHTYDGLVYLPNQDRLWESGGSVWRSGNGVHDTEEFNFNTLKWSHMASAPHAADGVATGYDPVTGHVFMVWCGWLTEYNPSANTWTTRGQNSCYGESVGAIDPVHRKFVVLTSGAGGHAFVYTLTPSGSISRQNLNAVGAGAAIMRNADAPGLAYDPAIKKIVGWAGGTTVYALNLSTSQPTWQTINPSSSNTVIPTPPTQTGTYGRWQYVPSKNAFVLVNGTNQDVYFYKLSSGSGTGTTHTPTPTSSTKFTTGQTVRTTNILHVRSTANGTSIGSVQAGTTGTIISGPQNAGNYTWWKVSYATGLSGWSAESYIVAYTPPSPILTFSASPSSIASGSSAILTWSSTNATSCTASGAWSGGKSTSGSQTITNLQSSGTYKLTCTGTGGSTAHSVSISVTIPTSTQTTTSTPASGSTGTRAGAVNIPAGKWIAIKTPERYKGLNYGGNTYYGMKHVSMAVDSKNHRIYFEGGDYMGARGFKQSYQQETWSLDLATRLANPTNRNAGWLLEYPYCGPAGQIQPKHPDTIGWVWDSKRSVFWHVPGVDVPSQDLCPGETYDYNTNPATSAHGGFIQSHLMTFNPTTKKWTDVSSNVGANRSRWKSVYDPKTDTIVQFALRSGALARVYNIATNIWKDYSLGSDANGSTIYINNSFMAADLVDRVIYAIDPFHGRLFRYNMDTHTITDLGIVPGGPRGSSGFYETYIAWDSVNHVLYWFNHTSPTHNLFYVYHPTTKQWQSMSTATNLSGINAVGRDLVFDSYDNALILMGGIDPAPPHYFYLYRYGNGSGTAQPSTQTTAQTSPSATTVPNQNQTQTQTQTQTNAPTPTLTFSASSTSVIKGGSTTLTWSSTNTTSCTASGSWGGDKSTHGSQTITNIQNSKTYTITCIGSGNGSSAKSITVSVTDSTPTIATLISNLPSTFRTGVVTKGNQFYTDRAYILTSIPSNISGNLLIRTPNNDKFVTGSKYLTFTLNKNATVLIAFDKSITTKPAWLNEFTNTETTVTTNNGHYDLYKKIFTQGSAVTLGGNNAYPSSASGSSSNYFVVVVRSTATSGQSGTNNSLSSQNQPTPTLTFSASSTSVTKGGSTTLTWSSKNATSCTAGGAWSGTKITHGSQVINDVTKPNTYTLICTGQGGKTLRIIGVTVNTTTKPAIQTNNGNGSNTSSTGSSSSTQQPSGGGSVGGGGSTGGGTPSNTGGAIVTSGGGGIFTQPSQENNSPNSETNHEDNRPTNTTTNTTQLTEHQTYLATLARNIRGRFIIGSTSNQVKTLQTLLASNKAIYPEGRKTGYYGPLTIQAVQRFQRKYGIVSHGTPRTTGYGYVGPRTLTKMKEVYGNQEVQIQQSQTTTTNQTRKTTETTHVNTYLATLARNIRGRFIIGSTSNQVKTLQTLLASNKAIYPEGRKTGYYGPLTIQAVQRFQRKYGIVSHGTPRTTGYGYVGPRTLTKMKEVYGATTKAGTITIPTTTVTGNRQTNNNTKSLTNNNQQTIMTEVQRKARIVQIKKEISALLKIVQQLTIQLKSQMGH